MEWKQVNKNTPKNKIINTCVMDLGGQKLCLKLIFDGKKWLLPDKSAHVLHYPTHYKI